MPNWCENDLKVRGPVAEVHRFVTENEGDAGEILSFRKAIPVPPDSDTETTSRAWGTKWDLSPGDGRRTTGTAGKQGTADYAFDTAWAPPAAWLRTVAAKYPRLRFTLEYIECGMGFAGRTKAGSGRVLEHAELDFQTAYIKRYGKEQWAEMTGGSQEDSDD